MARWRRVAVITGVGALAVLSVRRVLHDDDLALHAEGGVLMADAARYDRLSGWALGGFYAGVAADVVAIAPAGARVLELGCGPGHLARRLVRDHGLAVVGLDLDPAMVDRARRGAEGLDRGARPEFVVGDAAALPFADAEFDLVVSTLSLHHWTDPEAASAEIARVLRPGGRAVIWDIRPGMVPLHGHAPDPASSLRHASLTPVSAGPWRWPGPVAVTQRLEFTKAETDG